MRIGNEKHEKILKDTINDLRNQGYKVINLNGKSPTAIAINDNETIAITINKQKKKTITFLEDEYYMFDRIVRIISNNKENTIKNLYEEYNDYCLVILNKKSPDAIAYKNDLIFAVEVLGLYPGHLGNKTIRDKESIYDMFDGIMLKTFKYEDDNIFIETFGKSTNIYKEEVY